MESITLSGAITNVEEASSKLATADNDQAAAQAKYDAALAAKAEKDKADTDAVAGFNSALDTLIAAATAAKVDRSAPIVLTTV